MNNIFKAGASREDITCKIGTCLYGYRPNFKSDSIHDNLSVTALAFSNGVETVLMLTCENGDINTDLCNEIRLIIEKETNVPKENVIISATHTHSAPNLSGVVGWGEIDSEYLNDIFLPAVISASKSAIDNLKNAELSVGVTESFVAINRRQQYQNGEIGLGQNPHGCFDPNMTVISIRNTDTKEGILNLIHYGCHGTSAGLTTSVTRDWSGIMIDRLEKETGVLTAFWNGALGDVGPRLTNGQTTGDISYTEELGGVAATDAIKAYKAKGAYHKGELKIFKDDLKLPLQKMPTIEETEKILTEFKNPDELINIDRLKYEHYKETLEYLKCGRSDAPEYFTFNQTIISLGEVVFIPFPFEMFSEIVMRLREYSDYLYTLCLSCTNGYTVYLPSEDQLCRGGYEVGCFMYGNLFPLANNTDQHIINENLRIMNKDIIAR